MEPDCRTLDRDIRNLRKEFQDLRRMMESLRHYGNLEAMEDRLDRVEIEVSRIRKATDT